MASPIKNPTIASRAWEQLTNRIMTVCRKMMPKVETLPFGKILYGWGLFEIESEKYTGVPASCGSVTPRASTSPK